MKVNVFLFALMAVVLLSCCHDDKEDVPDVFKRVILVYAAGDNNLSGGDGGLDYLETDIRQMREASKLLGRDYKMVVFIDHSRKSPYFLLVENGDTIRLKTMSEDMRSSDATTLYQAMKYVIDNYKSDSYGLVLWGHADGWILRNNASITRRAYGVDRTGATTWMNIPNMAAMLERLPKLKFIFADCCAFLCVESAYELRDCADYIIGSPAEIPAEGAPYHTLMPALFGETEDFYKDAIDAYFAQTSGSHNYKVPLAAVKTSELENLAEATATTLKSFAQDIEEDGKGKRFPDVDGLIYYYNHTQFDMQDVMLRFASSEQYAEWKKVYDKAVPYHTFANVWMANHILYSDKTKKEFIDFVPTEERMGALGMFVPQTDASSTWWSPQYLINLGVSMSYLNSEIGNMQWYEAAHLDEVGW